MAKLLRVAALTAFGISLGVAAAQGTGGGGGVPSGGGTGSGCVTTGTGVQKGNGSGGCTAATATDYPAATLTTPGVLTTTAVNQSSAGDLGLLYAPKGWGDYIRGYTTNTPNTSNALSVPTHAFFNSDSKLGYYAQPLLLGLMGNYTLNSLGVANMHMLVSGILGSFETAACTGTCTSGATHDTTTAQSFGPGGGYVDVVAGSSITISPSNLFPFDTVEVSYEQNPGNTSFTYSINGAAAVTQTSSGTEGLGYLLVNSGISRGVATPSVVLTAVGTTQRFYTFGTWQKAQPGMVPHFLGSSGSTLVQWAAQPSFHAAYSLAVKPAIEDFEIGTNDAGQSETATTYMNALTTWQAAIQAADGTVTPPAFLYTTTYPRGINPGGGCAVDAATDPLLETYRTALYQNQATYGYAIRDIRAAFPDFNTAYARGLYQTDCIHPSQPTGANFFARLMNITYTALSDKPNAVQYAQKFPTSILLRPKAGVAIGYGALQMAGNGTDADSGTGMYFVTPTGQAGDFSHLEFKLNNITFLKLGALGSGSGFEVGMNAGTTFTTGKMLSTIRPNVTLPCYFYAYAYAPTSGTDSTTESYSDCENSTDATHTRDYATTSVKQFFSVAAKTFLGIDPLTLGHLYSSDGGLSFTASPSTTLGVGGGARGTVDTGIHRSAAGVVSIDTTTAGNGLGSAFMYAVIGPSVAPTGTCSVAGQWVFSKDGHATFCPSAGGTWATKI